LKRSLGEKAGKIRTLFSPWPALSRPSRMTAAARPSSRRSPLEPLAQARGVRRFRRSTGPAHALARRSSLHRTISPAPRSRLKVLYPAELRSLAVRITRTPPQCDQGTFLSKRKLSEYALGFGLGACGSNT